MQIWYSSLDTIRISEIGMRLQIGCPMRFYYLETRIEEMDLVDLHLHWGKTCTEAAAQGKKCNWEKTEESELVIFFLFCFIFFSRCSQSYSPLQNGEYWVTPRLAHTGPEEGPVWVTKTGVWTLNKGTSLGWIFGNTLQIVGLQESTSMCVCF